MERIREKRKLLTGTYFDVDCLLRSAASLCEAKSTYYEGGVDYYRYKHGVLTLHSYLAKAVYRRNIGSARAAKKYFLKERHRKICEVILERPGELANLIFLR